jgi:hypothetical protein
MLVFLSDQEAVILYKCTIAKLSTLKVGDSISLQEQSDGAALVAPILPGAGQLANLGFLCRLAHLNVCSWPEMTEVANREVDRKPHLSGHHHERHVPSQASYHKQQSTASLSDSQ